MLVPGCSLLYLHEPPCRNHPSGSVASSFWPVRPVPAAIPAPPSPLCCQCTFLHLCFGTPFPIPNTTPLKLIISPALVTNLSLPPITSTSHLPTPNRHLVTIPFLPFTVGWSCGRWATTATCWRSSTSERWRTTLAWTACRSGTANWPPSLPKWITF